MTNYGETAATIAKALEWGKFTHGFGMTKVKTDMKYLMAFGSVDSTSWLRADKFGGTAIFDNGRFTAFDSSRKQERMRYVDFYTKWGLNVDKIRADDLIENRKASIIAWREYANYMENLTDIHYGGKPPYLLRHAINGALPRSHPKLEAERIRRADSAKGKL